MRLLGEMTIDVARAGKIHRLVAYIYNKQYDIKSYYAYTKPGPTPDLGTRVPSRTAKVSFRCRLIGDRRRAGRGAAMESEQ